MADGRGLITDTLTKKKQKRNTITKQLVDLLEIAMYERKPCFLRPVCP